MKLRVAHLALAAGMLILAAACQNGGIYWTLQNEVPIEDLSLPNEVTIFDVAKIGGAGGDYYAAAGKIWTAVDDASVAWNKDERVQGPTADALCTALVTSPFTGNTLFGGFITPEANLGLYESDPNPTVAFTPADWNIVADPVVAGAEVALLNVQDDGSDELIVVTARQPSAGENFQFGVALSSDGTSFTAFTFNATDRSTEEAEQQIWDVAYAGGAINAWFATEGTELYTKAGPGVGEFVLATTNGIPAGEELTGLYFHDPNVYVASRQGSVYYSSNGTDWTPIAAPEISGVSPPLTRFAGPVLGGSGDYLLVGSDGYGYYRLLTPPASDSLTRCPDTTDTLRTASVLKLHYDDTSALKRIFACTSMAGLWRGDKDTGDPVDPEIEYDWLQE